MIRNYFFINAGAVQPSVAGRVGIAGGLLATARRPHVVAVLP
jgi:hypothetical protein